MRAGIIVLLCSLHAASARAEQAWFITAEAPAAIPISTPQSNWFRPGALPSVSVLRTVNEQLLVGARLRAGVLRNGPSPGDGLVDYGVGGLTSLSFGLRASLGRGLWVDAGGGIGVTGPLVRPVVELGVGWQRSVGAISVAPVVRYLYVQYPSDQMMRGSAHLVLAGLELSWSFRGRRRPTSLPVTAASPPPPAEPALVVADADVLMDVDQSCRDDFRGGHHAVGCFANDWDLDGIDNTVDQCPYEPEVVNGIDDDDGCPDKGSFAVAKDTVVLDARVLFKLNRSRVRSAGRAVLRDIVKLWRQHPEWTAMVIEGHSCRLGPERYNQTLSMERARRVRRYLITLGVPGDRLTTKGFGASAPVATGSRPSLYVNRRVELKMIREHKQLRGIRIDAAATSARTVPAREVRP